MKYTYDFLDSIWALVGTGLKSAPFAVTKNLDGFVAQKLYLKKYRVLDKSYVYFIVEWSQDDATDTDLTDLDFEARNRI